MFDGIISKVVLGWLRHAATASTAGLVVHGYLTSSQQEQVTGAVMTMLPILFSAYDKWATDQKHNAAILAASKARD